jgi:hypothetical protein
VLQVALVVAALARLLLEQLLAAWGLPVKVTMVVPDKIAP